MHSGCKHSNAYFRCVGSIFEYEVSCPDCGQSFRGTRDQAMRHPLWIGASVNDALQQTKTVDLPEVALRRTA